MLMIYLKEITVLLVSSSKVKTMVGSIRLIHLKFLLSQQG